MKPWIQLIRPSNTLTAISDVLAGVALACLVIQADLPEPISLVMMSIASMLLYVGGIVFNDVFDAKLDAVERPERPIPSGRIPKGAATGLGSIAFILGCLLRSEEHTSELQSRENLVCRLLLEKNNTT